MVMKTNQTYLNQSALNLAHMNAKWNFPNPALSPTKIEQTRRKDNIRRRWTLAKNAENAQKKNLF